MKRHSSTNSIRLLTSSCICFEGEIDPEFSTRGVYGGSPDKSSSDRTPRSCSSKLIKIIMSPGSKSSNKKSPPHHEVHNSSLKSEADSVFIAGRQVSVYENPPVLCPPTPPDYTAIPGPPGLDNAPSSFDKQGPHLQEETLLKHRELQGEPDDCEKEPSHVSRQYDKAARQGVTNDSAKAGSHESRAASRLLTSPPKNESLSILLEQDNCGYNELSMKRRASFHGTQFGASLLPSLYDSKSDDFEKRCSLDSNFSISSCRLQSQEQQICSSEMVQKSVSELFSIRRSTPSDRVHLPKPQTSRSAGSTLEKINTQVPNQSKAESFLKSFDRTDPASVFIRESSNRRTNEVFDSVSDRNVSYYESSSGVSRLAVANLGPELKVNLTEIQRGPCRRQFILNFRKTYISLDEGILSTELEIFFANDNTLEPISVRKEKRQESSEGTEETTATSLSHPVGQKPASSGQGPNNAVMGPRTKSRSTLFCGCLGSR
eukprot:g4407.t1